MTLGTASPHFMRPGLYFLALVLGWGACWKLCNPRSFTDVLKAYRLLPTEAAPMVARALPAAELMIAGSLLLRVLMPWPALAAALLLVIFGLAIAINLIRGRRDISCGCFGSGPGDRLSWGAVIRNSIGAGGLILASNSSVSEWNRGSTTAATLAEDVMGLLIAVPAVVLWQLWRGIANSWRASAALREELHSVPSRKRVGATTVDEGQWSGLSRLQQFKAPLRVGGKQWIRHS